MEWNSLQAAVDKVNAFKKNEIFDMDNGRGDCNQKIRGMDVIHLHAAGINITDYHEIKITLGFFFVASY